MKSFPAFCLVLTTLASASEFVSIPLTRVQHSGASLKDLAAADRARAAFFRSSTPGRPATVPATNLAYSAYTTSVGIGRPPTYYNLVVDTGSSNTFCGAGIPYNRTSTSISTGQSVEVVYGDGSFSGIEYLDQVTLAPNLVIVNQSIGDALQAFDFQGVDGIIGLGPPILTIDTLSPDVNATIPTIMNNLVAQNIIQHQVLGVSFAPATDYSDTNGALTYGGADRSLYEGELTYAPVTETVPSSYYWGINVTSVKYGDKAIIPKSTAGVVDTGTTLILLADDFFDIYLKAIPGAQMNSTLGLIEIPLSSVPKMKPLHFMIANRVFTLDVAAQLIPQYETISLIGVAGNQYGMITNMGTNSGEGLDFILGQKFMERFYAVFDADNNRVGFAQTNNTFTVYNG